jgi:hypothetical protein
VILRDRGPPLFGATFSGPAVDAFDIDAVVATFANRDVERRNVTIMSEQNGGVTPEPVESGDDALSRASMSLLEICISKLSA